MNTVVMICASRGWVDPQPVEARLTDLYHRVGRDRLVVIHSERRGADRVAADWAERWQVPHIEHTANWDRDGRLAGRVRDAAMLDFLIDQRDEFGADVELVVFRLPDDRLSSEVDRVVQMARAARVPGHMVRAHVAA